MEFAMFGAHPPPADFTVELQEFLRLDDVQRKALSVWFESTSTFEVYPAELPPDIRASTMLPEQFRKAATSIRYLLNAWHRRSLKIEDIERDLLLLGLTSDQIKLVADLLQRLSHVKERSALLALESDAQIYGLPTLDDLNIMWDARGIFGGPSFYYFGDDANETTYKKCFGISCVAVVEFVVSDSRGVKERIAFQMNETVFNAFVRAIDRAKAQLGSFKELIKPLTALPTEAEGE